MTRKVFIYVCTGLLAVVGLAWYAFGSSSLRQYEVISKDVFYRAAVSSVDEFTDVEAKVSPAYVMIGMHEDELKVEPWATIIDYAWRNNLRVGKFVIAPDGSLSNSQAYMALIPVKDGRRLPVLVISADGAYGGMVAAAYRLSVENMPLNQVEKLAALPDAPADTTRRIREFARAYDEGLRAAATQPTPGPATNAASN